MLLVVVVGGLILQAVLGSGNVTATDVQVGDCLAEIPDGDKVVRVQTVGCDQPHAGEVFAVISMPDGDFPGEAAVEAYHEKCGPELSTYSPAAMTPGAARGALARGRYLGQRRPGCDLHRHSRPAADRFDQRLIPPVPSSA